jgi:predicted transposase/invertase (TIGR01784 family)
MEENPMPNAKSRKRAAFQEITPATHPELFIPGTDYLMPTIDVIFKILMTRNPEALKNLLNAVLQPKNPIVSLSILNPEILPASLTAKAVRLDIHAKLEDNTEVDIEMQTYTQKPFARRAIYYTAQLAANALAKGGEYEDLPDVCGVYIFSQTQFPDFKEAHSSYEIMRHIPPDGKLLSPGLFRLDFLELPKADSSLCAENRLLWIWSQFLAGNSYAAIKAAIQEVPELLQLMKDLETVSNVMTNRQLAAKRRADARIYELAMKGVIKAERAEARAEGLAEGKAEGKAEGETNKACTVAQNLLKMGMPRTQICEALNITDAELTALLASPTPTTTK